MLVMFFPYEIILRLLPWGITAHGGLTCMSSTQKQVLLALHETGFLL